VQQALRSVGLPSVLTFEPARYEHPEYLWLAALVYVLTHPGDEFEIVGLLRELEGVSDADIANYRWPDNANQRSLRLAAHPHDSDPVAQHLHRWHELVEAGEKKRKAHHSLYDVLLFWVEGSGLRSRLAALPEGTERVKGLDALLLRTAGELSELDSLKTLAEAWRAQSDWTMSAGAPEATEAIQLLTAQKAKGLEWDTVILPFLGQKIGDGSEKTYPQFQLPVGRPEYLLLRPSGRLTTEEWTQQDAGAEEQDNLERKRLAYVAVTRARRNLILIDDATLWAKTLKSGETKLPAPHLYAAMVPTRDEASYPPVALTECEALFGTEPESIPATPTSAPTSAPESVAALPLTPSLNLLKKHKPSEHSVEHEAEEESEKDEARPNLSDARTWPVAAPKDPIVYGLWWHEVMRLWPWSEAVKVQTAFAQDQLQLLPEALRPRGEHELQTLQSSPLAQQLSGLPATQILRELPYLRLLGTNTVEDGKMDFLYSLDRKTWRILDWKTDGDPTPSVLLEKYASQLDAYCEASRAHGLVVESTQLYATVNGQLIAV
jgi:ATP-dependent exoDNAse (exonuclease V) beta subunit